MSKLGALGFARLCLTVNKHRAIAMQPFEQQS
jgi:hypothetical protein